MATFTMAPSEEYFRDYLATRDISLSQDIVYVVYHISIAAQIIYRGSGWGIRYQVVGHSAVEIRQFVVGRTIYVSAFAVIKPVVGFVYIACTVNDFVI